MQGDLLAFVMYVAVGSITPGPNNLMLLQGSLTAGMRACSKHALGISSGSVTMAALSYWGVTEIILAIPGGLIALKVLGSAYLLWLTWGMFMNGIVPTNEKMQQAKDTAKWQLPLNFWQAAVFQYVNPKAWTNTMLLPAICVVAGTDPVIDNVPLYALYFVLNLSCIYVWIIGGSSLKKILHKKKLMRVVSTVIIVATLYCAASMWF